MNMYKRILKDVGGFQEFSEDEKKRVIYLYKHKYLGYLLFLKETEILSILLCLLGIGFVILGVGIENSLFFYIDVAIILLLLPYVIANIYLLSNLKKCNNSLLEAKSRITEKISNIYLLNSKVITQKTWRRIKKYDKNQYRYLRSKECNHECYRTTDWLANFIKDPEIKILWIGVDDIFAGYRCGHSVLRKGDWVYDSNFRRTYKFKKYMEAFKAEIFREISLEDNQYFKGNSYEITYQEFNVWCKESGIKRSTED